MNADNRRNLLLNRDARYPRLGVSFQYTRNNQGRFLRSSAFIRGFSGWGNQAGRGVVAGRRLCTLPDSSDIDDGVLRLEGARNTMDPGVCPPGTAQSITGTSEHPGYHPDPQHRPPRPMASDDLRGSRPRDCRCGSPRPIRGGSPEGLAPQPFPAALARYAGGVPGAREDLSEPRGARSARPG